jgi:hypothetical protein
LGGQSLPIPDPGCIEKSIQGEVPPNLLQQSFTKYFQTRPYQRVGISITLCHDLELKEVHPFSLLPNAQ